MRLSCDAGGGHRVSCFQALEPAPLPRRTHSVGSWQLPGGLLWQPLHGKGTFAMECSQCKHSTLSSPAGAVPLTHSHNTYNTTKEGCLTFHLKHERDYVASNLPELTPVLDTASAFPSSAGCIPILFRCAV